MDPIMGVSSLHCCLAGFLHSFFCFYSLFHCARLVLSFVLLFFIYLHLVIAVMWTFTSDTFCFYSHFGNGQKALHYLGPLWINNFREHNISYGINPYSVFFFMPWSKITKVNSTIHFLGFNWGGGSLGTKWSTDNRNLFPQKTWHCIFTASLHNRTYVITSCFWKIEHIALISSLNKKREFRNFLANRNIVSSGLVPLMTSVFWSTLPHFLLLCSNLSELSVKTLPQETD